MTGDDLIRRLRRLARERGQTLEIASGRGDHVKVYLAGRMAVLPGRRGDIKTGTMLSILKQLGITRADLE